MLFRIFAGRLSEYGLPFVCPFALASPHRAYLGRQVGAKSGPELLNILDLRGGGGGGCSVGV